jgi:glutathione synthase/RimK-type ligase-like ATP-grasp enzyme
MIVGLSAWMGDSRPNWLEEFKNACTRLGWEARVVEIGRDDWERSLQGVDMFVWRPAMGNPSEMAEIRIKLPLMEAMGIACFPNSLMLWLYDDKIRETFFMRRHRHPMPGTFVSFDGHAARAFAEQATYPLIAKTHSGAAASGVVKLGRKEEAFKLLKGVFREQSIVETALVKYWFQPRLAKGNFLLERYFRFRDYCPRYAYFQEFITTDADWRITTMGRDLISIFVRRNRPHDFRASGSGIWERVELDQLPVEACDLALEISNRHGFTSMAYDVMKGPKGWVIGEISMTFILNDVYCTTLYRKTATGYEKVDPIPIGVMHLNALKDAIDRGAQFPPWPMS